MKIMDVVQEKVMRCLKVAESELFHPETNLFYDYRTSLDHEHRFDHLPTPEDIAACQPNPCSWRSGQEDCAINGGVALDMYIHAGNAEMASKVFRGLELCGRISGVPGFLARSVSPRDGKSFYPESSRDQYTHYVCSLRNYFHSELPTVREKESIIKLLSDAALFCEKYVTPENNWMLPRADFAAGQSSVCKMWETNPHEIARLPMIYAAAWSVTGDEHFLKCFNSCAGIAAERSMLLRPQGYNNCYALMQMMFSCRLIYDVAPDARLKEQYKEVMSLIDEYLSFNILRAGIENNKADYSAPMVDWHDIRQGTIMPDCRYVLPLKPEKHEHAFKTLRECSEGMLTALMHPEPNITALRKRIFRTVLNSFEPETHYSYAILYFPAVWYLARKLNIEL